MRTANRDRCGQGLLALGLALILCALPAAALSAEYEIFGNGTAFRGSVEVEEADEYQFVEIGILGERVNLPAEDVVVINESGVVAYEEKGASRIEFPEGNYTIRYRGPIHDKSFQAIHDRPYTVEVLLPPEFDVQNPLLGYISPGGEVTAENESVRIRWEATRFVELRYYDSIMERALVIFGTFWLALCAIFLFPYLLVWLRDRSEGR
jgi:hypothetical protein